MLMMLMASACDSLSPQNLVFISLFLQRYLLELKMLIIRLSDILELKTFYSLLQVINIRPFMTFTNRVGEDIFLKFSSEDDPKILRPTDSRIPFTHRETGGRDKLQVSGQLTISSVLKLSECSIIYLLVFCPTLFSGIRTD